MLPATAVTGRDRMSMESVFPLHAGHQARVGKQLFDLDQTKTALETTSLRTATNRLDSASGLAVGAVMNDAKPVDPQSILIWLP